MIRLPLLAWFVAGAATAQAPVPPQPGEPPPSRPIEPEQADADTEPGANGLPVFPPGLDPVISVYPLNPRLDQEQPWQFTPEGRVIPRRREPRPPIPVFRAPLANALSSRGQDGAIELTLDGQPSLGATLGIRISRLETAPALIELTVGETLALDGLDVRAYDSEGEQVDRTPVRLEIEGPEGFVDMVAFERDRTTLRTLDTGIGRIWVTSLLPTSRPEPVSIPLVLAVREAGGKGVRMSTRIYENVPEAPR